MEYPYNVVMPWSREDTDKRSNALYAKCATQLRLTRDLAGFVLGFNLLLHPRCSQPKTNLASCLRLRL